MTKSASSTAQALLLGLTLSNGVNFSVVKTLIPHYTDADGLLAVRMYVSAAVFCLTAIFSGIRALSIQRQDIVLLALCAFFGIFCNQYFFLKGMSVVPPVNASLMVLISPVAVLGLSVLLKRERLTYFKALGMALAGSGAALLIVLSSGPQTGGLWWGYVLILFNSFCWSLYVIMVVPLVKKYPLATLLSWLFIIGSVYHLAALLITGGHIRVSNMDTVGAAGLAFSVVFATLFAYSINTWSLKHLKPGVASSFIYLQPVAALAFAVLIGKDSLSLPGAGCAVLIFTGVWLVNKGKGKTRPTSAPEEKSDMAIS